MTDVSFAKNADIAVIGLAKNEANKAVLAPYADAVLSDIARLRKILE